MAESLLVRITESQFADDAAVYASTRAVFERVVGVMGTLLSNHVACKGSKLQ